jgi:hypothetical protein
VDGQRRGERAAALDGGPQADAHLVTLAREVDRAVGADADVTGRRRGAAGGQRRDDGDEESGRGQAGRAASRSPAPTASG